MSILHEAGRRSFLLRAIGIIVALPTLGACDEQFPKSETASTAAGATPPETSTEYFSDASLDSARAIGKRYLAAAAPNASAADITTLLAPTVSLIDGSATDAAAVDSLRTHVQNDFANGNIFVLEGWVFATTELHLCALLAQSA